MSWINSGNLRHSISMDEWEKGMNVWQSWSEAERRRFLYDKDLNTNYASHNWNVDLPASIRAAVVFHITNN